VSDIFTSVRVRSVDEATIESLRKSFRGFSQKGGNVARVLARHLTGPPTCDDDISTRRICEGRGPSRYLSRLVEDRT
jgi:hypothetical protein